MQTIATRQKFCDFGQYREQSNCWDTEAVQLSPGPLSISFDSVDMGDVIVSRLRFDRDALVRSTRKPGWRAIVIGLTPRSWCGIDVPAGAAVTAGPQQEVRVVSHGAYEAIALHVQTDTLLSWKAPLPALAQWLPAREHSVFRTSPDAVTNFSAWVEKLISAPLIRSANEMQLWVPALRQRAQQHLLALLGRESSPIPATGVQRVARYELAGAALQVIDNSTAHRLTVTELAGKLGVTCRALEYAFLSVLSVSPAQYLLAERLNRARYSLHAEALTGSSVTSVAFDHHFEDLGRFARHYARLFGERPSETLQTARRTIHHRLAPA
jgi:AraC family ethanolamine operon transcriptional activator